MQLFKKLNGFLKRTWLNERCCIFTSFCSNEKMQNFYFLQRLFSGKKWKKLFKINPVFFDSRCRPWNRQYLQNKFYSLSLSLGVKIFNPFFTVMWWSRSTKGGGGARDREGKCVGGGGIGNRFMKRLNLCQKQIIS